MRKLLKDLRAACISPFWEKRLHKNRIFRRVTDLPLLFTFFSRYIQSRTCSEDAHNICLSEPLVPIMKFPDRDWVDWAVKPQRKQTYKRIKHGLSPPSYYCWPFLGGASDAVPPQRAPCTWAATSENVPSNIYAQRRTRIACAFGVWLLFIITIFMEIMFLMQIVYTLIRRRLMRRLIWVYTICRCPFYRPKA